MTEGQVPPPAPLSMLTPFELAVRYAAQLAHTPERRMTRAGRVYLPAPARHIRYRMAPLRALEQAKATGDELLAQLVAKAVQCDRDGLWTHDYGPRKVFDIDEDTGIVTGERIEPSRCSRKHDARGACSALREQVYSIRCDRWGRAWARVEELRDAQWARLDSTAVSMFGNRDASTDPMPTGERGLGSRRRLEHQAAAMAVYLLRDHAELTQRRVAEVFFGKTLSTRHGRHRDEVHVVRRLESIAKRMLATWRLYWPGI